MPSYDVTYITERKMTIWIPEGTPAAERTRLALDHIAMQTYTTESSKILSCVPTDDTTAGSAVPLK